MAKGEARRGNLLNGNQGYGLREIVGDLSTPSLAVVFTFDRKTLRHKTTKICSEKRAANEWNKANGIKI